VLGAGSLGELGHPRPGRSVEQQDERHRDADEESGERVEDRHPEQRRHRRDEVRAGGHSVGAAQTPRIDPVEPHERSEVDELRDRHDDDPASVASGSFSNSPVSSGSVTIVIAATTRPDTWLLAPAEPFTAVLDRRPLTTIPLERPDTRLAVPRPTSSC
jgi:hypothetical protein